MSWWCNRKDKTGTVWLVEIDFHRLLLILVAGVVFSALLPIANALTGLRRETPLFPAASIGLMALGYMYVLWGKVSLFRRGIWVSWGPRLMTRWYSGAYKVGYMLVGAGMASLVLTWLAWVRS
jgi:hypothetical protein